jgi:hypothetical protein
MGSGIKREQKFKGKKLPNGKKCCIECGGEPMKGFIGNIQLCTKCFKNTPGA